MENNGSEIKWLNTKNLNDIGELTAQWIEGNLPFYPLYGGETLDEEGFELRQSLTYFNRNGFVTTFSQPAEILDNEGFAQRACVEGLASEKTAKKLSILALTTNLLVFAFPPAWIGGYQIPITLDGFQPYTWCGGTFDGDLEHWEKAVSSSAFQEINSSWTVVIIDLVWGRKDYLWQEVSKILSDEYDKRYSVVPGNDIGTDFLF